MARKTVIDPYCADETDRDQARTSPDRGGPWWPELRATFALAWPVVLAELGWMTMSLVDALMVAPLGSAALAAVGLGSSLYFAVVVFGMGLLLGLDTLVSQSFGAGQIRECRRWLIQGLYLAVGLTPPLMVLIWLLGPVIRAGGVHPDVLGLAIPYLDVVAISTLPLLVYTAIRRYLQARSCVRPVMVALVSANLINLAADWMLIHGHLGLPRLGVVGAAWATSLSRVYMMAVLMAAGLWLDPIEVWSRRAIRWSLEGCRLRRLLQLGWPAALQATLECGVFALATALAGVLGPIPLAAHMIVLNVCALTFMVPLGVSSAGAVRVGQAVGRGDGPGRRRAGWVALGLGVGAMAVSALTFLVLPRSILGLFRAEAPVIAMGIPLLAVAATFQLFDGLQVVAIGVLRGVGDTRTPMLCNLIAYWGIGLPLGYLLGFPAGLGVLGLWIGLAVGLIVVGSYLVRVWARRAGEPVDPAGIPRGGIGQDDITQRVPEPACPD